MTDRIYIAATGAGAGAQNMIWQTPGCSKYFTGATFPYGHEQLTDFLGYAPEKSVCEDVAIEMAMMAYYNAYQYGISNGGEDDCIGFGCTAAVATNRERKGDYVAYVSSCSEAGVSVWEIPLERTIGVYNRMYQGDVISQFIYDIAIDNKYGSADSYKENKVGNRAKELLLSRSYWTSTGKRKPVDDFKSQVIDPVTDTQSRIGRAIYPGAFNPPHAAHLEIARVTNSVFNIEISPPHKSSLTVPEILQRLKLLKHHDVLLTDGLPLYLDKSNAFPGNPLVLGADSLVRMLDPKWGPDPIKIIQAMSQNETRLYIVGREVDGKYISANEAIALIPESGSCYDIVPVELGPEFQGYSSSAIRNAK